MSSEKTARRLSRILAVLPWIIEHDGDSIEGLIERFGYRNKADLVKDLHLVFMTGLPGYGPGDLIDVDIYEDEVFVDAADYFARPLRLTAPEALGLLAAGMTFIESDQAPPALESAVRKLSTALVPDVDSFVHFDVPTPESVALLREAIDNRQVIAIEYVAISTNERTIREVEGDSVFFNLGNWYLRGWCRLAGAERVFRVDRIAEINLTGELYSLDEAPIESIVQYRPDTDDAHVSFTIGPASRWVTEYYPTDVVELDSGDQRVTMSVSDPLVAARLLIRLGKSASDIEGQEVVEAMDVLRERIASRYERTE
ncbi:MAG: WYL domain-containing protein [Actinomycetota bacterium]